MILKEPIWGNQVFKVNVDLCSIAGFFEICSPFQPLPLFWLGFRRACLKCSAGPARTTVGSSDIWFLEAPTPVSEWVCVCLDLAIAIAIDRIYRVCMLVEIAVVTKLFLISKVNDINCKGFLRLKVNKISCSAVRNCTCGTARRAEMMSMCPARAAQCRAVFPVRVRKNRPTR